MNNSQNFIQEEQEIENLEEVLSHSRKEKPDHYLGAFDTTESITEAYKIINKTAYSFYNSNKYLFKSNGYEPEDLVNEIHVKLLHKFKEQENPFWVDTYSNLKTICIFTLNKLIRIITQESKPLSNPLSMFTTNNDDTENNMEDVLFNTDSDRNIAEYGLYISSIKEGLNNINPLYSKIFSYSLYLNDSYLKDLTISKADKDQLDELLGVRFDTDNDDNSKIVTKSTKVKPISIIEKLFPKIENPKKFAKDYSKDLIKILQSVGLDTDTYLQDQNDYKLITKGGSLEGLSDEDIKRLRSRGAVIDEDNLKVISLKDEAKRLTEIEKPETGNSYRVINGTIVKKLKSLSNKEKRALQYEKFSNSENLYGKSYSVISNEGLASN